MRQIEPSHLGPGFAESRYPAVVTRLLAANALAHKLVALGYERASRASGDAILASRAARDFERHRHVAASVYRLLGEIGVSTISADRQMLTALKSPSFAAPMHFAKSAGNPLDFLVGSTCLGMAAMLMMGVNYRESSYAPHSRMAEAILNDPYTQAAFSPTELSEGTGRFGKKVVNSALRRWVPMAANFFGPPGSGFTYDCLRFGLKSRDNQELAELFLALLERRLVQLGLDLPALSSDYPRTLI